MKFIIPLLLAALSLVGCAEMSPYLIGRISDASAWDTRKAELEQFSSWTMTGRVAVQSDKEGWSATLHWDQDDENYVMRFIAPLGQGTYELEGDTVQVSLLTAENRIYNAQDPENLMQDNLGWSVPLHGLKYWVRGIPEPGVEHDNLVLDEQGRMTDLQQSGWRISILRYMQLENTDLPGKLFMSNDRFKLRIVVAGWKTGT